VGGPQRRGGGLATVAGFDGSGVGFGTVAVGIGTVAVGFGRVAVGIGTVAVGLGGAGFSVGLAVATLAAAVGACFTGGFGEASSGVALGATPATLRGRSRTTASKVGSGVGWVMASMSAACERGDPPPQAAHIRTDTPRITAKTRVQLRMQGLRSS